MNSNDIELPPLPEWADATLQGEDRASLFAWAEAAIEADRARQGDAAQVLAELVALIPLADTLNASASCQDLIDYFKGVIADRKRRGEPVGEVVRDTYGGYSHIKWKTGYKAGVGDKLYLAPQPTEPVAYLDLGVGGYMDLGTALTDEQLAALPKGRHMLAIVGTYGVDGYTEAAPQPAEPVKVPSDEEIETLVRKVATDVFGVGEAAYDQDDREFYGRFARALLARYTTTKEQP